MSTVKPDEKLVLQLLSELPSIIEKSGNYSELYGVELSNEGDSAKYYNEDSVKLLLGKLCKAYNNDHEKISTQLVKILKWRSSFNPLSCGFKEKHNEFLEHIGIITSEKGQVITWNIYGELIHKKDEILNNPENLTKFIRYRVGLMERGIQLLLLNNGVDASGNGPANKKTLDDLYMIQVHDYATVSMFNRDPNFKKTVKEIIEIFQEYYPEWLKQKFFVNVHWSLGFIYNIFTKFINSEIKKKFVVLSDSHKLGEEYLGEYVPKETYGGNLPGSLASMKVKEIKPNDYILHMIFETESELD
ncbi:hypothetical protein ACO0RG_001354 [Hanseniaspora osmophila]